MSHAHGSFGIDVGGTSVRIGFVDDAGSVRSHRRSRTKAFDTAWQISAWLAESVRIMGAELGVEHGISPIGLAVPGTLDRDRKVVVRCVRVPILEGNTLLEDLESRLNLRPTLLTDADAATWGEYTALTPPVERFVHLRLGTGAALGVVICGRLERLDADRRRHLEVLVIDDSSEAIGCPCGRRGCLETLASWPAMDQRAHQLGVPGGLDALFEAEPESPLVNDDSSKQLLSEVADAIGKAIRNLETVYRPDAICLGGGGAAALPTIMERLIENRPTVQHFGAKPHATRLVRSRLGDDAGIIGAAKIATRLSAG